MAKGKARRNGGGEIRMSDIAHHAGVSPMTVSRALREPATVSEKMRRKVDAAVREFGYLPNRIAGSLSSRRSNVVGLIVPSIRNSLYASTVQAISDVLRANGLHLMIANSGHRLEDEEALVSALLAQRVCGLILHNTSHSKRLRELVRNSDVPVVETGNLPSDPLDMAVSYSNFEAARAMTAHLGRLGYRRIGLVTLPLRDNDRSKERRRGYFAALRISACRRIPVWFSKRPAASATAPTPWCGSSRAIPTSTPASSPATCWRWARCSNASAAAGPFPDASPSPASTTSTCCAMPCPR